MKKPVAALFLFLSGIACVTAQTVAISPHLFGINYWYYDYASGFDSFDAKKATLKVNGINLVRLGGILPQTKLALTDLPAFDLAIDRVNSIGATPLLQLPINLAPADIPVWIGHFKSKGISYWSIGNEPEPVSNFAQWFKGVPLVAGGPLVRENGNTYAEFRDKFVTLARAVKNADPAAIVIGPDFHQFYGTKNASDPLMSYYPAFIADVGALTENRVALLDVFALHYYGFNPALDNKTRFDVLQGYLNSVNVNRSSPLRMAVSEVNATPSTSLAFNPSLVFPWDFEAGQFLASVTKNAMANGADFVAPWSVYESSGSKGATDFSLFNANGTPRSTMVHFSLLANTRRSNWIDGTMSSAVTGGNSIVSFGMTDTGGSTLILMNTSLTARTYSVGLDGRYSKATRDVKFFFSTANPNPVEWQGVLPAKTTFVFTVDANGRRLKRVEYNKAISDAAQTDATKVPLLNDLTVSGGVNGDHGNITLSALLPAGVARGQVDFYVDGFFEGSTAHAPFALVVDATTLTNGTHSLTVAAYDADGNVDRSAPHAFAIANPVDVSAQLTTSITALVYNRATQAFNGRITLTNNGTSALSGPLQLELKGLPAGVALLNGSGMHNGAPYLGVGAGLAPGASVTAPLSFANPSLTTVHYFPVVYSGNF